MKRNSEFVSLVTPRLGQQLTEQQGKVEGVRECDRRQDAEHAHIHEQVRCDMFT